jgi:arginase
LKIAGKPIAIIEAPSNLGLKPPSPGREPGTARAPDALRRAGFHELVSPTCVIHVAAPPYAINENRTVNVRNIATIADYSRKLADAVEACLARGEFPVVLGGDCSILIGSMLGLRRRGEAALLFIDGHTDFHLPEQSATGGAAGMDLAFVTGWGPDALTNLEGLTPYVREDRVAALGNRDLDRVPLAAIPSAGASRMHYRDLVAVREAGMATAANEALHAIRRRRPSDVFLHVDVDVLDSTIMPAVDSPQADGLRYDELTELLHTAIASGCVTGMEVTIFDPDLDPDGELARKLAVVLSDSLRISEDSISDN